MGDVKEFGGSIPVENVQALAAATTDLKQIPARYVRAELDSDVVLLTDDDDESLQVPVIDLTRLLHQHLSVQEMAKLHAACLDWGFFQLINHGVPEEVIQKMKEDTEEFFRLPLEEKKVYSQAANNIEGYGQAFVVSAEQKLDWGDMLFFRSLPVDNRDVRFLPKTPISYRETLDRYSAELQRVAVRLIGLMANNLGLESEKLTSMFEIGGTQGLKTNYYPPCPYGNKVLGISPHSDATALTLLLQVNQVQGLQIKKNGNWVPIKPISDAFIINVGDIIEIMSNGIYKSIEHRVVVNSDKERLSIAAFHGPMYGSIIGPLPDLVKDNRENYKTISRENYLRLLFATKLDGKNLLDLMRA